MRICIELDRRSLDYYLFTLDGIIAMKENFFESSSEKTSFHSLAMESQKTRYYHVTYVLSTTPSKFFTGLSQFHYR